jgi:hypothetical protein
MARITLALLSGAKRAGHLPLVYPLLTLLVAFSLTGCGNDGGNASARQFAHDFRGKPLPTEFGYYQLTDPGFLQTEPEGLRIKIPDFFTVPSWGVGIRTLFSVRGNFEATAVLEVLHIDPPQAGTDAGVSLALHPVDLGKNAATGLDRFLRTEEVQGIRWYNRQSGKRVEISTLSKICSLRLKRTGTILHYLWSPGTRDDAFQEIGQADWPHEIEHIRVVAFTTRWPDRPAQMDFRLHRFHVRGDLLSYSPESGGFRVWLFSALLVGLLISSAVALTAWLAMARRRPKSFQDFGAGI